jgi:hypothetical protein
MARSKQRAGNPDGTPRLELAVGADEEASDAAIIAAIQASQAEEAEVGTEAGPDGSVDVQEASRPAKENAPFVLNEEAEQAEQPATTTYWSKKKAAAQAKETATWLLMIIEGAAILGFGEDARLLPHEKRMITEPLARIMARLDPGVNDALNKYVDPILLVFGLATWGTRLYAIAEERNQGDEPPNKRPPEVTPPPPSGNGRTVDEVLSEDEVAVLRAGPPEALKSQVLGPGGLS